MDLHREDEQRLLSDEVAEAKRKLFWECYTDDIFAVSSFDVLELRIADALRRMDVCDRQSSAFEHGLALIRQERLPTQLCVGALSQLEPSG
jgi:hypothetical protein